MTKNVPFWFSISSSTPDKQLLTRFVHFIFLKQAWTNQLSECRMNLQFERNHFFFFLCWPTQYLFLWIYLLQEINLNSNNVSHAGFMIQSNHFGIVYYYFVSLDVFPNVSLSRIIHGYQSRVSKIVAKITKDFTATVALRCFVRKP